MPKGFAIKNLIVSTSRKHVLLTKFNRPRSLNALSGELLRELGEVLTEAAQNSDVRCVVLTGDDRAFSAGADIKEMPESGIPMWAQTGRLGAWKIIERFPKPLIAAVNGYALGGGCELTMLCDVVVIGANAKFGFPEIKVGAFPGDGGTQRAPRAIGKARAMWMMMTGEQVDAERACNWGLGSEVVPVRRTVERALEIAVQIADMSPIAESMIKQEVLMAFQKPLDESLSLERKLLLWQTDDHEEGIKAFTEKRPANYKGR